VTGVTTGSPFLNPYSARAFDQVQAKFYEGCDLAAEPAVEGETTISASQQAIILEQNIEFESSSQKLGVDDAVLTVTFKPESLLPQSGIISL